MTIDIKEIYWLAGLLEGEGSFQSDISKNHYPSIKLKMTDIDIIRRAHRILNCTSSIVFVKATGLNVKHQYHIEISGNKSIGWMFTLYPLLGVRRQEKIRDIILKWKERKLNTGRRELHQYIKIEDGKKICVIHGPLIGMNAYYNGKYIHCKGCAKSKPAEPD